MTSTDEDEMDCDRDPSLKDASSLSQLVDSVVAEVQQSMLLNEAISGVSGISDFDDEYEPHTLRTDLVSDEDNEIQKSNKENVPKITVEDVPSAATTTNEEEELSEFWDQVITFKKG